MSDNRLRFNAPPGWPKPPGDWTPPKGWTPDPSWPAPPPGWQLWVAADGASESTNDSELPEIVTGTGGDLHDESELRRRIALLQAENAALRGQLDTTTSVQDVVSLDDERILQEAGIYRYHHPLENAVAYKDQLSALGARIAELIKTGSAIEASKEFTFDNSLAKGRRMTAELSRLMLRAFNAEVDNCLRSLRAGNALTAIKRVTSSRDAIAKHGRMMQMQISEQYFTLRIEEIELSSDYLMKKQEEREEAREERARLREERKVNAELIAEREKLNKERTHLVNAIESLRLTGASDLELESKLSQIDEAIADNDYRTANIRAGYVYVISNRGAFGSNVVKIGLTRRLEPLDRVNELGGAAVPFRFDVHGLFFSEDAVSLETDLHHHFASRRVNHANSRKEFFFASPSEVRNVLVSKVGNLLEFTEQAESLEYLQSVSSWPTQHRRDR